MVRSPTLNNSGTLSKISKLWYFFISFVTHYCVPYAVRKKGFFDFIYDHFIGYSISFVHIVVSVKYTLSNGIPMQYCTVS